MVIANGHPKAGNHALVKGLQLLGVPCAVNHIPYAVGLTDVDSHILVVRDPRNMLVSWVRFKRQTVTQGTLIAAMKDFNGKQFSESMSDYVPWLADTKILVVRFEDLISSDAELRRISDHLCIPYIDDAFSHLPGMTASWSGAYSDWRDHWTDELNSEWNSLCPTLLSDWGY